ncbi:selenoprotein O-like isoform X1 [Leptotrombidium deliense]|uniref:Selenoprotein O n=1 Tax=Leptotrombidium deliense TaxID=299467 RepID=A0A443SUI7_9ACAR|nr:selenoprotein O-like isoform X1 [Leptotrombidium deliense]
MLRLNEIKLLSITNKAVKMANRSQTSQKTLETLCFDNKVYQRLPVDTEERNFVRTVNNACFSRVKPTPLKKPQLVCYSRDALKLIDINESEVKRPEFVEYFCGNKILPGSEPGAHCYCGHQFGVFAGQLGDGAAILLGEIINQNSESWELQLKGAGLTPYSRSADGRKVLRSSIREFLCSEAMHFLGIPTTRAATCITSDDTVTRDMFYDGHPRNERCTVVSRIAQTFIRFGSFEIIKTVDPMTGRRGPSVGRHDILKSLLEYVIECFYSDIHNSPKASDNIHKYKLFYEEIVKRTAKLVALWQCVGFCHGVLNTDNMSITGLTIDYGPFGFLDRYDSDHICNSSDDGGRYTYKKQPEICKWNLMKLAEVLDTYLPKSDSLKILEDNYYKEFNTVYLDKMRKKLGLFKTVDEKVGDIVADKLLVEELLNVMERTGADFTNCFRHLNVLILPGLSGHHDSVKSLHSNLLQQCSTIAELIEATEAYALSNEAQLMLFLLNTNPQLLAQLGKGPDAIERIVKKFEMREYLKTVSPEVRKKENERLWNSWIEKYIKRIAFDISEIKEDTAELEKRQSERIKMMNSNNPRFILRNHIAQRAIEKAELGDFSEVWRVLKILENPYAENIDIESLEKEIPMKVVKLESLSDYQYDCKPPSTACKLRVS